VNGEQSLETIESQLEHDPQNQDLLLEATRHYHRLAMQGDDEAFEKASHSVKILLAANKKHAEALAVKGSLLTIMARTSGSLLRRIYYSIKAAWILDRAVKIDPTNIAARTIRAFTALVLPGFLRRLKTAVRDFEYLVAHKQANPTVLPDEMMPKVYFNLGLAHAKNGDNEKAIGVLSEVISRFPDTREAMRAKRLLAKIE
jgi:tetratricopeptide (TPR) repeat protein